MSRRKKEKISYEISPDNRLVIRRGDLAGYRQVLDGRFTTDTGNNLIYQAKLPPGERRGTRVSRRIKLTGRWSLDANHDLQLNLEGLSGPYGREKLRLAGEIFSAEKNKLVFAVRTRSGDGRRSTYLLKLTGCWQEDENNRLTFRVEKGHRKHDTLTFDGIWEVNRSHQIIYRYRKYRPGGKTAGEKRIIFRGHWDIRNRKRLCFWLDLEEKSGFEFKVSLNPVRTGAPEGKISFRVGIGVSRRREPVRKTVTLYGRWRVGRRAGLYFEIEPSRGRRKKLLLGGNYRINKANDIEFTLSNRRGKVLAAGVTLKRKFFKDEALAFLKLRKAGDESAVEGVFVRRF